MAVNDGYTYTPPGSLESGNNVNIADDYDALPPLASGWNDFEASLEGASGALADGSNQVEASVLAGAPPFVSDGNPIYTGMMMVGSGVVPDAYIMRAYKITPTIGHVYWVSFDLPDLTGQLSGYPVVDLADIIIVREPCLP